MGYLTFTDTKSYIYVNLCNLCEVIVMVTLILCDVMVIVRLM